MRFFDEIGARIEQSWRRLNFDEEVFPDIAANLLTEAGFLNDSSSWDVIRQLLAADKIPSQADISSGFGNPPITVYNGTRFYIDVYFWLDGTTSVHQHAFCGAFQVLQGASIHSSYRFHNRQKLNQHFQVGRAELADVELLETGAIKKILPGEQYIHSLFHLDRPSVTLCVRTYHTASGAPQYNYRLPYFGIDPFFKEPLLIRQSQAASLLLNTEHPDTETLLSELLGRADFQTAFTILETVYTHVQGDWLEQSFGLTAGPDRYQRLLEISRSRHGDLVDLIQPVFDETQRQNNLIYRRGLITNPEHRFFLALLLNVPDRVKFLDLVKRRFPDNDPVETVCNWVDELSAVRVMGSAESNVLGINGYDNDYLLVLECLLNGYTVEQTMKAFVSEFSGEYAASLGNKPMELHQAIRNSILFKSIFQDLPTGSNSIAITAVKPASV